MKARLPGGLVLGIFLTLGSLAMVFVRAFGSRGDGWNDIREFLPVLAGALLVGGALVIGYSWFAVARLRRLEREHPSAVLFTAEMTPELKQLLKSRIRDGRAEQAIWLPHFFTVVATSEGLRFWRGCAAQPKEFWRIEWPSVLELKPAEFPLQYKTMQGIRGFTGDPIGALEIAPFPDSILMASWDREHIEALMKKLNAHPTQSIT